MEIKAFNYTPDDFLEISILLFDYINHDYVAECIASVREQTLSRNNFELIILTDRPDASACYKDFTSYLKCKIIFTGLMSVGESLLVGLKNSSGKIICPFDNDDFWKKERLEIIKNKFTAHNLVFLKNEILPIDKSGKINSVKLFLTLNVPIKSADKDYILSDQTPNFIKGRSLMHNSSSMAISREVLESTLYNYRNLYALPDILFFFIASINGGKMLYSELKLTVYRTNNKNSLGKTDELRLVKSFNVREFQRIDFQNNLFPLLSVGSNSFLHDLAFMANLSITMRSGNWKNSRKINRKDLVKGLMIAARYRQQNFILLFLKYCCNRAIRIVMTMVQGGR